MKISKLYDVKKVTNRVVGGGTRTHDEVSIGPHNRYEVSDANWLSNVFTKYKDKGIVVISSDTSEELTDKERLLRAERLGDFIRSKGFGYRQTFGGYTYEEGNKTDIAKGEFSFLVPLAPGKTEEDLYNLAVEAGEMFGQESVSIWLPSYQEGKPHWLGTNPENKESYRKPTHTFEFVDPVTSESDKEKLEGWTGERKKGEANKVSRETTYSPMAFAFKDSYDVVCHRIPSNPNQAYFYKKSNKLMK